MAYASRHRPRESRNYYVYILVSRSRVLYVGVTNDLARRVYQHKQMRAPGFTARYLVTRLAHFEATTEADAAIAREKQIKGWSRAKKIELIESHNPAWRDLSDGWYEGHR